MTTSLAPTTWSHHQLLWGQHTHIMGIANVTPDSFSGDGLLAPMGRTESALIQRTIALAKKFVAEGATLIDVGGESTRPNAPTISAAQELARVIPVLQTLHEVLPPDIMISIDTYKAEVAERALAAGACIINDIWGLQHDPEMAVVASKHSVPVVLMANMIGYRKREIVSDVIRFLSASIDHALSAGIAWDHIIIDPGIGFGTTAEEGLTLLRRLSELRVLGRPILLGTSRKSHIGKVLGGVPASERLEGTAASVALGIAQGADIVRVHDVHEMVRVAKMSDAIVRGTFTLTEL